MEQLPEPEPEPERVFVGPFRVVSIMLWRPRILEEDTFLDGLYLENYPDTAP